MKISKKLAGLAAVLTAAVFTAGASADEAAVKQGLARLLPDVTPDSIEASAVPGLYEVLIGPRLYYMSEDGDYLLHGKLINTKTRENLTEAKETKAKKVVIDAVSEDSMIVYGADDAKHTITVFTDIDCGYCRKLHREMEDYTEAGIKVRYLFYPRAGVGSPSYQKAVSVWCADDSAKAMTAAKTGGNVEDKTCENPVQDHMELGELMGVNGTPALVLDSGQVLPGYIPADRLAKYLNAEDAK